MGFDFDGVWHRDVEYDYKRNGFKGTSGGERGYLQAHYKEMQPNRSMLSHVQMSKFFWNPELDIGKRKY